MAVNIIKGHMVQVDFSVKSWKPSQVQEGIHDPVQVLVPVPAMTTGIPQVVIVVRTHGPKPI
jgi:hypothetical protein